MRLSLLAVAVLALVFPSGAQRIPTPEEHLGHQAAADHKLASYETMVAYFRKLEAASPRVTLRSIGHSTEGREMIVAEISSAENIRNLPRLLGYQAKLHDPRKISGPDEEAEIMREAKTTILLNCGIHASEVAAAQMSMELAYELASSNEPRVLEILDNCIVQLIFCANPDGLDMVKDWYDRHLGTRFEAGPMPWLYQKYVGHDNNRDWWLVSQKETQAVTRYLYETAFPTVLYDIHQMGGGGARFFVPPFHDPPGTNVDPLMNQAIMKIGAHMAVALAEEGRKGVAWGIIYDNWWQGGMRTTPQRHNIVGILTEAASARLASPATVTQLSGHDRGLPDYMPRVNFPDPWPGGVWRMRDVAEYQKTSVYALLQLGARYRDMWIRNHLAMSRKQLELGRTEAPYGWVIPTAQHDPAGLRQLLTSLIATKIEVYQATEPFVAGGRQYPAGTLVLPAEQPYRLHLKDMMEPQVFPNRRMWPGGPPERPYDVAGWTAPLQMGVEYAQLAEPISVGLERFQFPERKRNVLLGGNVGLGDETVRNRTIGDSIYVIRALTNFTPVILQANGTFRVRDRLTIGGATAPPPGGMDKPRVALYQPWTASMDEGWTRFVWEEYNIPYTTIHNADIRAGSLNDRFTCIFLPSESPNSILNGVSAARMPEPYAGGIGTEGLNNLKKFVENGGTLVLMDSSCGLADRLGIPVRNALERISRDEFFCPGSVLATVVDNTHPVAWGMPENSIAYFRNSNAFEITEPEADADVTVIARYRDTEPLLSGFLLGEEHLRGRPAIVEAKLGDGYVVMLGFPVQNRGQPVATFKYMFNAMIRSVLPRDPKSLYPLSTIHYPLSSIHPPRTANCARRSPTIITNWCLLKGCDE